MHQLELFSNFTPNLEIELIITDSRIQTPEYATIGAAAVDLRACIDETASIAPGETLLVKTGIKLHIKDARYAGFVLPRSGLGTRGLVIGNTIGLIDSDYQGEIMVTLMNRLDGHTAAYAKKYREGASRNFSIQPLDRIAQLVIMPVKQVQFNVVSSFSTDSGRGVGGHGSTGMK